MEEKTNEKRIAFDKNSKNASLLRKKTKNTSVLNLVINTSEISGSLVLGMYGDINNPDDAGRR